MSTSTIELLSTDELIAAVDDLNIEPADTNEERQAARLAYRAAVANYEVQWQEWLRTTYLPSAPNAVHEGVFDYAWREGHASGYSDVEGIYIDLAALANTVHTSWV